MDFATRLRLTIAHLRLPFQLILAPIFLWAALLSGGGWDAGTSAAFLALHLFLYPAATAFNAVYDRDEGPVSGLEQPPPVPPGLRNVALVLALLGAGLALFAGLRFLAVYALIVGWTGAYSHPAVRLKASPWKSAAAIGLGQGAIGFLAGWVAADGADGGSVLLAIGALGAALTALGLYPSTQVFQVAEDEARGDRTLAVALGPAGALRFGAICLGCAGVCTVWLVATRFGPPDAFLVALGYAGLILAHLRLAHRLPALDTATLYRRAVRLTHMAAAGFLMFLALEALGSG